MKNKNITAKEAYNLANTHRNDKTKELLQKAFTEIWKATQQGYFNTYVTTGYYTDEVVTIVANQLRELGYVVYLRVTAITIWWIDVK